MKYLFFIFVLFTSSLGYGQLNSTELGSITGTVMDKDLQEPIPYATLIIKTSSGELVTGSISSENGSFIIEKVPYDSYIFLVQFMGYKNLEKEITISSEENTVDLGTIYLEADVSQLEDVLVVAERTTIEQLIDRKVVHVGRDLSTSGASAAEIMNKIPSVQVDMDGNISLRGDGSVRVLVDGKPTNVDTATLLKQIPSSSIEKIELITNPSAKYNPEGMSGIINIVLKKNSRLGFNGNITGGLTLAEHIQSNASLNMNYHTGKFNFYTNLGVNSGEDEELGFIREVDGPGEDLQIVEKDRGALVKAGVDYYLNEKNVISFYTNQNFIDEEINALVEVTFPDNPAQNFEQDMFMELDGLSSTYNFNYKRDFKKEGHNIELEMDYNLFDKDELSRYDFTENPEFRAYEESDYTERSNFLINVDYVNPLSETAKLELGTEARFRETENDYASTNEALPDILYSYQEDIYSFYGTFGQDFNKWAYQFGARLENFTTEAIQNGEQILKKDYFTVYPSAFVTYTPSKENSYQMSYSRRINRPSLWQLNPTRDFATTRLTSVGNPELDPEFINSLELNYTHKFKKEASLRAGVFYRVIKDDINQIILEDPENPQKLLLTYDNIGDNSAYGVELSGNLQALDFWELRANFNLYSLSASGIIGTTYIEEENVSYRFSTNHDFEVTEQLKLQLFGMYAGPIQTLQFKIEDRYFINLGARYSFLDDKASLSINFNDVFNTRIQKLSTTRPVPQIGQFKDESQNVQLGFSYRFGSGKNRAREREERNNNSTNGGGMF